jgi:8-oxo-dGTP diphosphatase
MTGEHQYNSLNLVMHVYLCNFVNVNIVLNEHVDFCWLEIEDLDSLDWAEADKTIVEKLMNSNDC